MEYNVFELLFKAELKRLKLRKKDVAKHLNLTMPTLKGRVEDPEPGEGSSPMGRSRRDFGRMGMIENNVFSI